MSLVIFVVFVVESVGRAYASRLRPAYDDRSALHRRPQGQHSCAGTVREPGRDDDRILRLLHLCDGGGARVSGCSFPRRIRARPFWRPWRRSRSRSWRGRSGRRIRTFRRSHRTQDHTRRGTAHDGFSTVVIGLLPTYETIGIAAPALLALCRFGQGLDLAASGAAPCSWRWRTRRPGNAHGAECFRSWAPRSGSSFRAPCFSRCRAG